MNKICLGTAQMGFKYGINNKKGELSEIECFEILELAEENNVEYLDTAAAYGKSEHIIGKYLKKHPKSFKVISKAPYISDSEHNIREKIVLALEECLERFNKDNLDGYLIHDIKSLSNRAVVETLENIKNRGYIKNIGASVYKVEEAELAASIMKMDYLQCPVSVLDHRFKNSGVLSKLKKKNIKIFARSVYLQGLILMRSEDVREKIKIDNAWQYIERYRGIANNYNVDYRDGALKYVYDDPDIDYIIVGVETKEQLRKNIDIINNSKKLNQFYDQVRVSLNDVDERVLLPYLW